MGQKEYSPGLGLMGRSQSVKHTSYSAGRRKGSLGSSTLLGSAGKENLETEGIDEEDEFAQEVAAEGESDDEGSVIRVNTAEDVGADYVEVETG